VIRVDFPDSASLHRLTHASAYLFSDVCARCKFEADFFSYGAVNYRIPQMIEKCKIRVVTGEPDGSYFLTGRPDLEDFSESLMISPRLLNSAMDMTLE